LVQLFMAWKQYWQLAGQQQQQMLPVCCTMQQSN
jgi:hypothetical protein